MFGVGPIRTRAHYTDAVQVGPQQRSSTGAGAESALQRTRSLLESATKHYKHVMGNYRLAADVKADELAALSLLRSLLEELESCIMENENPPPSISKRKALIKVEKARRGVLAAVRECSSHVTESQKLFAEIERFTELRPEEPVSPRSFNIRWARKGPLMRHNAPKRKENTFGRRKRGEESLVMSIIGLSAVAEGLQDKDRDTPTSDASGPITRAATTFLPPPPGLGSTVGIMLPQQARAAAPARGPLEPTTRHNEVPAVLGEKAAQNNAAAVAAAAPGTAATAIATAATAAATVSQTVHGAALLLQQMQLQPSRKLPADPMPVDRKLEVVAEAVVDEMVDDMRPSISHGIAPSTTTTTMCNMDSCISVYGPPPIGGRPSTATAGARGGDATESNPRSSIAGYDDDDDDDDVEEGDDDDDDVIEEEDDDEDDEVNSAERDAGSPNHKVSLLGCAKTAAAAAAVKAAVSGSGGGVINRSTASTPHSQHDHGRMSVAADAVPLAGRAPSVQLVEGLAQTLDTLSGSSFLPTCDSRRRGSGTDLPVVTGAVRLPPPPPLVPTRSATDAIRTEILLDAGSQADAAAVELDAVGLFASTVVSAPPPPTRMIPPPPRYVPVMPRHLAGTSIGSSGAAATHTAPPQMPYASTCTHPVQPLPPPPPPSTSLQQQQQPQQHPVDAAAHSHSTSGCPPPLPPLHSNPNHNLSTQPGAVADTSADAAGAAAAHPSSVYADVASNLHGPHSVPPSVPSSLRDFPLPASATRPSIAGSSASGAVAAAAAAVGSGARQQHFSAYQSLDSGHFPASATAWDTVSLADTEPASGAQSRRNGRRRRGGPGGLLGFVRHVVGFVGVSVLGGAAIALGAAAVNTGLDEQEAAQQVRQHHNNRTRWGQQQQQRLGRGGGDDLIPQRTLQQLRSPDLLALGRG